MRADADPVKDLKDGSAIEVEQSEEVSQKEKPKKLKKTSRWRRFLTFLHIRRGYFSVFVSVYISTVNFDNMQMMTY